MALPEPGTARKTEGYYATSHDVTGIKADGRKTVATAGTAEALVATSIPCQYVILTTEIDNTGVIVIGANSVVATLATRRGIPLDAGDTITIPCKDAQSIYLDSTVSGDGVTYIVLA